MKKLSNQIIKSVVDASTGEVIDVTTSMTYVEPVKKEPFFLTYSRHMSIMYSLNKLSTVKVLWKLLELSEYNTNEVNITAKRKSDIIAELQIALPTYNLAIKELIDAGLIFGGRGTYTINEQIYWKGDYETRERMKNARLKITVEPEFE